MGPLECRNRPADPLLISRGIVHAARVRRVAIYRVSFTVGRCLALLWGDCGPPVERGKSRMQLPFWRENDMGPLGSPFGFVESESPIFQVIR